MESSAWQPNYLSAPSHGTNHTAGFLLGCRYRGLSNVTVDRDSNRSKGFGFVEMSSDEEAKKAVDELNGKELDGRAIVVSEARPREERPRY